MADANDLTLIVERALYDLEPSQTGGEIVDRPDWLSYSEPAAPTHYRNGVLRADLAADAADTRIRETIQYFEDLGVPFRWVVGPSTRPLDLAERLVAHGFRHHETLVGMAADPAAFPVPAVDDVEIVTVGPAHTDEWLELSRCAWPLPDAALPFFRSTLERDLAADPQAAWHLIARIEGTPAATAAFCRIGDSVHFCGGATHPDFRRRGLYPRLVFERMRLIRELGFRVVTNHCVSTTSAPICDRLGFERVCEFHVYVHGDDEHAPTPST